MNPKHLRLFKLAIPVDDGMVDASSSARRAVNYRLGMDEDGALYLIYRHTWPSIQRNRPRLSTRDPQWSPFHGLRYIEWVPTP